MGPIDILVTGSGPVFEEVYAELAVLESAQGGEPAVVFHFVDDVAMPAGARRAGPWRLGNDCIAGESGGYSFCMRRDDTTYVVDVAGNCGPRPLIDGLKRAWDWTYLGPVEKRAKNFMYGLFDTVTALALLEHMASYIHASSFVSNGVATALVAWGGVGKTTAVLRLMADEDVQYLSDDLGLVGEGGRIWRTPKRLQIYGYNVVGEGELKKRLFRRRGPMDRLNWHWRRLRFGPRRVRRRVSVEELFGDEAADDSAQLKRVVFLERVDVRRVQIGPVGSAALARRAAAILIAELEVLFFWAAAAEGHGVDCGVGGCRQLHERMQAVLEAAFSGLETCRIRVPIDAGPEKLASAIRDVMAR